MASWASHNKGSGTALWITFVACILDFCLTSQAESIAGQSFVQHPKSEQSDAQNLHEFVDSPSLQKTSIFEIFDVENKVEDYRQILLACYAEIRAGSGEVAQQIYEDDVVFFEGGGVDNQMAVLSADPSEVAAKELHRRIRELHLSGEAYALLTDENEQSRRSTALWEQFSRDAVASLLQHNPRF